LVIGLILAILSPLIAQLMQLAISRRREFLADANGAMLTRYPAGLASALKKLAADPEPLEVANKATAHLYIVNPLKNIKGRVNKLFSTHPPIEERIAALEKCLLINLETHRFNLIIPGLKKQGRANQSWRGEEEAACKLSSLCL